MISKFSLKVVLWIIAPFAFFGNIAVLVTTIRTLSTVKLNSISIAHRILVANLAAADGLMGAYLVILTIVSTVFSGSFCLVSRTWRASILCNVMGALVIISSQASVFILMLMGLFRLYTILRPFEAQYSKITCRYFYTVGLSVSWVLAILVAIIPWFFDYFITEYYYSSLFFETNEVKKSDYQNFIKKLDVIVQSNTAEENSNIFVQKNISINGTAQQFTSRRIPDVAYSGSFGFYSQNSICLPSYFARTDMSGWQYTIAIITLNFTMFVLMAIVYMLIAYYGNPMRHPALRAVAEGKRCFKNGKFNFQKCKLHHRVARLILTDFLCWIPLCSLSYSYFSGVDYDKTVIAVCGIILLPINSALNPILYSSLFDSFVKKTKRFFGKNNILRTLSLSTRKCTMNASFSTTSQMDQSRKSHNASSNDNIASNYI